MLRRICGISPCPVGPAAAPFGTGDHDFHVVATFAAHGLGTVIGSAMDVSLFKWIVHSTDGKGRRNLDWGLLINALEERCC